jgi:hypothetical protein
LLEFAQVLSQIEAMAAARSERSGKTARALALAGRELIRLSEQWETLADRLRARQFPWILGIPLEPLGLRAAPSEAPPSYTVVATDGSQIAPDRHEVSSCFLLNISRIRLTYGCADRPLIESRPRLYHQDGDLSVEEGGVRLPIEGKYLAIRRMLEETLALAALTEESESPERPCVAMADGTLIQWPISREASGYSGQALDAFLNALDRMRACQTPIVGYISAPGGSSVVAAIRAALCPEGLLDGRRCNCASPSPEGDPSRAVTGHRVVNTANGLTQLQEESLPSRSCADLALISDSTLFGSFLGPGERSAVFESTSQVLSRYGEHAVCFFYLNVCREVARVEFPRWVFDKPGAVDLVHAVCLDQAVKGRGYPVALAEAHERAVVRAEDRALFYTLVERAFIKRSLPSELSLKSLSKRQPAI